MKKSLLVKAKCWTSTLSIEPNTHEVRAVHLLSFCSTSDKSQSQFSVNIVCVMTLQRPRGNSEVTIQSCLSGTNDRFPLKNWMSNTTTFLPLALCWNPPILRLLAILRSLFPYFYIIREHLAAWLFNSADPLSGAYAGTNLSLSAVKMTLRSSSREAKTRRSRRRLNEEKRHSKSTCSRRESDGRHSCITCGEARLIK